jgi:hypothetical protein
MGLFTPLRAHHHILILVMRRLERNEQASFQG